MMRHIVKYLLDSLGLLFHLIAESDTA